MSSSYSYGIAKAINSFLTGDDWNSTFDDENGKFRFNLSLQTKLKNIQYLIYVGDDHFTVYAVSSVSADDDSMAAVAEFISRANYGLRNGNFELDFRDGEIRYKCYVDCEGVYPGTEVIRSSIYTPAAMFKRYGDGLLSVIFAGMDPKDAVERCEKS